MDRKRSRFVHLPTHCGLYLSRTHACKIAQRCDHGRVECSSSPVKIHEQYLLACHRLHLGSFVQLKLRVCTRRPCAGFATGACSHCLKSEAHTPPEATLARKHGHTHLEKRCSNKGGNLPTKNQLQLPCLGMVGVLSHQARRRAEARAWRQHLTKTRRESVCEVQHLRQARHLVFPAHGDWTPGPVPSLGAAGTMPGRISPLPRSALAGRAGVQVSPYGPIHEYECIPDNTTTMDPKSQNRHQPSCKPIGACPTRISLL